MTTENNADQFELADDGTMDTVIRCKSCGAEARFNYDPGFDSDEDTPDENDDAANEARYDEWVEECIESMASDHDCEDDADEPPIWF